MELLVLYVPMVKIGMVIIVKDAEEVKSGLKSIWVVNVDHHINGMAINVSLHVLKVKPLLMVDVNVLQICI